MALTKTQADGINLADTFAFTGTVSGAGLSSPLGNTVTVTGAGGSNTTNLEQSLTKGWTRFNGSSTVADSLNTSSVTDRAVGKYQMNHSNNMNNANYVVHFSQGGTSYTGVEGKLGNANDNPNIATNEYHVMVHAGGTFYDVGTCCASMIGDLA